MEETRELTHWDKKYSAAYLDSWLYGTQSLSGATRKWLVSRVAQLEQGTSFLDLGCGGGVTAYHLLQAGLLNHVEYTGVDFTAKMIELARSKIPRARFVHSSIQDFALSAEKQYDAVLLRAVLEHIEQPLPVIDSATKLLRPGGLFFLIFWNNPVDSDPIVTLDPDGFFDIAHSAPMLHARFLENDLLTIERMVLTEPSARGGEREIWVMQRRVSATAY